MTEPSPNPDPNRPPNPEAALNEIVDDVPEREKAQAWAIEQILAGRTSEDVAAELIGEGWGAADAEVIAEEARRATRRQRGIVTRSDVAATAAGHYSRGLTGGWIIGFPLWAAIRRLLHAISSLLILKKIGRK